MAPLGNDRWRASFHVSSPGRHEYTVIGWVDRFLTWRHDVVRRQNPADYFTELALHDSRECFRPNLWPNTPDILPEFLQYSGRPGFLLQVALAATLGASYGIYGPAYELMEHDPLKPGGEEYLDSEKFQLRNWECDRPDSLRHCIARLNRVRRENPALQSDWNLSFHAIDNALMLCYSKTAGDDTLVMVANLDPHHVQAGWVDLPLAQLGLAEDKPYQAHDLLSGAHFLWQGGRNFVSLDPQASPLHILRLRRRLRSEHDFDYFL